MTEICQLFEPTRMGSIGVPNRVFMAPLTRNRADADGTPGALVATYYAQRASAGMIVSEATQISAMGKGYLDTPGIYTEAHVEGWRRVTQAVHAAGGRIFCQLWHVGRISHVSLLPEGQRPLAPSALTAEARTFTANGFEPVSEPVEMSAGQIQATIGDYAHAAQMAKDAGFDGIEVHAANGYLIDQFLQDGTNRRHDHYGGEVGNRLRLLSEVLEAVNGVWDLERIGVRLSPLGQANDIRDTNPESLFASVYDMLHARRGLAYLHVIEEFPGQETPPEARAMLRRLRRHFDGFYIANGGYDAVSAAAALAEDHADAVAFGRAFIANPDLPSRLLESAPLAEVDAATLYGGGAEGYTDYPFRPGFAV